MDGTAIYQCRHHFPRHLLRHDADPRPDGHHRCHRDPRLHRHRRHARRGMIMLAMVLQAMNIPVDMIMIIYGVGPSVRHGPHLPEHHRRHFLRALRHQVGEQEDRRQVRHAPSPSNAYQRSAVSRGKQHFFSLLFSEWHTMGGAPSQETEERRHEPETRLSLYSARRHDLLHHRGRAQRARRRLRAHADHGRARAHRRALPAALCPCAACGGTPSASPAPTGATLPCSAF